MKTPIDCFLRSSEGPSRHHPSSLALGLNQLELVKRVRQSPNITFAIVKVDIEEYELYLLLSGFPHSYFWH